MSFFSHQRADGGRTSPLQTLAKQNLGVPKDVRARAGVPWLGGLFPVRRRPAARSRGRRFHASSASLCPTRSVFPQVNKSEALSNVVGEMSSIYSSGQARPSKAHQADAPAALPSACAAHNHGHSRELCAQVCGNALLNRAANKSAAACLNLDPELTDILSRNRSFDTLLAAWTVRRPRPGRHSALAASDAPLPTTADAASVPLHHRSGTTRWARPRARCTSST